MDEDPVVLECVHLLDRVKAEGFGASVLGASVNQLEKVCNTRIEILQKYVPVHTALMH